MKPYESYIKKVRPQRADQQSIMLYLERQKKRGKFFGFEIHAILESVSRNKS
jgi:hypothetical protein